MADISNTTITEIVPRRRSADIIVLPRPRNRLTAGQRKELMESAASHRKTAADTAAWLIRYAEVMERAVKLGQFGRV